MHRLDYRVGAAVEDYFIGLCPRGVSRAQRLMKGPTRMKVTILTAAGTLLILGILSPSLRTRLWHARHEAEITYRGRTFPVPRGWYPEIKSGKVDLTRFPPTVFSSGGPLIAWAFIGPIPQGASMTLGELYRSFEQVQRSVRSQDGDVTGPLTIGSGQYEAFCVESVLRRAPSRATATCLLFRGTWSAEFIGDKTEMNTFLQVIRGAK